HAGKGTAWSMGARAEEAAEPAAAGETAVFHEILRFEVGAGLILRAGAVDDREFAVLPERLEIAQLRRKREEAVEGDCVLWLHADAWTRLVVLIITDGRDEAEPICATAKEDDDERGRGARAGEISL